MTRIARVGLLCAAGSLFVASCVIIDEPERFDMGQSGFDASVTPPPPVDFDPPASCAAVYGVPLGALADPTTVRIGLLLPESGPAGPVGREMVQAAALALEEFDARGGFADGRRLGALACDSRTDPVHAFDLAVWLTDELAAPAIVGPGLSAAVFNLDGSRPWPGGPVFVSPSATHPDLASLADDGLFWRTAPSDARWSAALGTWARRAGVERLALVAREDAYGEALMTSAVRAFCEGPCPLGVTSRHWVDGGADPAAVAEAIRADEPGAVLLLGQPFESRALLEALAGFEGVIGLGEANLVPEVTVGLPVATLDQLIGAGHAPGTGPVADRFAEAYRVRWGAEPGLFAQRAYDAVWLVAHAVGALPPGTPLEGATLAARLGRMSQGAAVSAGPAGWDPGQAAFRDPGQGTFDLVGASGPVDLDSDGEASADIHGWRFGADGAPIGLGVVQTADGRWQGP